MSSFELFKIFCHVLHTGYQGGVAHFRGRLSLNPNASYDAKTAVLRGNTGAGRRYGVQRGALNILLNNKGRFVAIV